jgi:hypothetical protein
MLRNADFFARSSRRLCAAKLAELTLLRSAGRRRGLSRMEVAGVEMRFLVDWNADPKIDSGILKGRPAQIPHPKTKTIAHRWLLRILLTGRSYSTSPSSHARELAGV